MLRKRCERLQLVEKKERKKEGREREEKEKKKKRERENKEKEKKRKRTIFPKRNHKTQKIHRMNCHIMIRKKKKPAGRNYLEFFFEGSESHPFFN